MEGTAAYSVVPTVLGPVAALTAAPLPQSHDELPGDHTGAP